MHVAFGRVRRKTSPTGGVENVYLFLGSTINAPEALARNNIECVASGTGVWYTLPTMEVSHKGEPECIASA